MYMPPVYHPPRPLASLKAAIPAKYLPRGAFPHLRLSGESVSSGDFGLPGAGKYARLG